MRERLRTLLYYISKPDSTCACWNRPWDRWNTADKAVCGQQSAEFKPNPTICPCRCHELEYDYLFTSKQHFNDVKQIADLTTKLYNMEETVEPNSSGGPTQCHCKGPRLYDANCRRWLNECRCTDKRIRCTICKGWSDI